MTDLSGFKQFLNAEACRSQGRVSNRAAFIKAMNNHLSGDVFYGLSWLYAVQAVFPHSEQTEKLAFEFWQSWLFARGCRNAEKTGGVAVL